MNKDIKEVEETPCPAPVFYVDPAIKAHVLATVKMCKELGIDEGMVPIITRAIRLDNIPVDEKLSKFLKAHKNTTDVYFMERFKKPTTCG